MAWQGISPDVMAKWFRKCRMSNGMDGTDDNMLWNSSEEECVRNVLGMNVKKMKALTAKTETVTLIG